MHLFLEVGPRNQRPCQAYKMTMPSKLCTHVIMYEQWKANSISAKAALGTFPGASHDYRVLLKDVLCKNISTYTRCSNRLISVGYIYAPLYITRFDTSALSTSAIVNAGRTRRLHRCHLPPPESQPSGLALPTEDHEPPTRKDLTVC